MADSPSHPDPPTPSNTPSPPEPWADRETLRASLQALLISLRDEGAMSDDQIARFCVRHDELAGLMRDIDKLALSLETAEALTEFLDDAPDRGVQPLATAIKDWRKHMSIVRWSFKWEKLPPAIHRKAQRRRSVLVSNAQQNRWITRDKADMWQVTDVGRQAIDRLNASHPDGPASGLHLDPDVSPNSHDSHDAPSD